MNSFFSLLSKVSEPFQPFFVTKNGRALVDIRKHSRGYHWRGSCKKRVVVRN